MGGITPPTALYLNEFYNVLHLVEKEEHHVKKSCKDSEESVYSFGDNIVGSRKAVVSGYLRAFFERKIKVIYGMSLI